MFETLWVIIPLIVAGVFLYILLSMTIAYNFLLRIAGDKNSKFGMEWCWSDWGGNDKVWKKRNLNENEVGLMVLVTIFWPAILSVTLVVAIGYYILKGPILIFNHYRWKERSDV